MAEKVGNAYLEVTPKLSGDFNSKVSSHGATHGSNYGGKFSNAASKALSAGTVALGNILANVAQDAASKLGEVFVDMFAKYGEYEQLVGGAQKIFDEMDYSKIAADASNAYKELNMSANQYLSSINLAGATFAQTMGDEKGYDVARKGMMAIADYASGTGRNLEELNQKYQLITRASSSYQSIADQFSGILPATSKDFLEQAKAAGFLSEEYEKLTDVPVAEYQEAVTQMLEKGVADMGLAQNTMHESFGTLTGSLAMTQSAWDNFITGMLDEEADIGALFDNLVESVGALVSNLIPRFAVLFSRMFTEAPQALVNAIQALPDVLQPALAAVFGDDLAQSITDKMRGAFEWVGSNVVPFVMSLVETIAPIVEGIGETVSTVMATIGGIVDEAMTGIGAVVEAVWPTIESVITGVMEVVVGIVEAVWPHISGIITSTTESVRSIMSYVWPAVQGVVTVAAYAIKGIIDTVWPAIQAITSTVMGAIGGIIESVWGAIQGIVTGAVTVISAVISGMSALIGIVEYIFGAVKDYITGPIEEAASFIGGIIDEIIGFFSGLGQRITDAIGSIHFPLPHVSFENLNIGGVLDIPLPHVEWYAKGGIFDQATVLAGVGEAGPEAVVPLQGRYMLPFARAIAAQMPMAGTTVYSIGDVTVDASSLKDIATIEDFASMILRAKSSNPVRAGRW